MNCGSAQCSTDTGEYLHLDTSLHERTEGGRPQVLLHLGRVVPGEAKRSLHRKVMQHERTDHCIDRCHTELLQMTGTWWQDRTLL